MQRSWAKGEFQNPVLSMVHEYVHFFYCSVLNMECVEGKTNSLCYLTYTFFKSLHILVTSIEKLMPNKQKWYAKALFIKRALCFCKKTMLYS